MSVKKLLKMKLYPLQFEPIYKYRIWGGEKLKTVLKKKYDGKNIGESWEVSDVEGDHTKVKSGSLKDYTLKELIKEFKGEFLGKKVYENFGENFPLLIKFIDAKTPLSIQVHPSDELARKRHNSFGKNEMWYVIEADNDAELIVGFNQRIGKSMYLKHLKESTLTNILNVENVKAGDTFYIPAGRVHAIGAGVLLAEIQQTSDVTYRIHDYDRVDPSTGKKRELHNTQAAGVIDYNVYDSYKTAYQISENNSNTLVHTPYFKTNIIQVSGNLEMKYSNIDSFVLYICVDGALELIHNNSCYNLRKGETMLLGATIKEVKLISGEAKILEISM